MRLRFVWPGRTRNREWRLLQEFYLDRIRRIEPCELIETKEARGLKDREVTKIKELEAKGFAKHLRDDYIICLSEKGKAMSSEDFAGLLGRLADMPRPVTFIVGGFAGLAPRILGRASLLLSLSRMTFSHELSRVALLEQVYRALTIQKGMHYAK